MVWVSIITHEGFNLHIAAPWIGPSTSIESSMSRRSPSPVVYAEGETFVVVGNGNSFLLERWEISIDAEWWAQWGVECRAIGQQHTVKKGLQCAIGLTLDLMEDVRGLHGTIGWAGQPSREPGTLEGEMTRVSNGACWRKMSGEVRRLFWKESPRIQLQTTRY